MRMIKTARTGR